MNRATEKFSFTTAFVLTSCQPTTTSLSILTTSLQRKCFHNQEGAENAFQEFAESQNMDFYATGINKLISCWEKCVDYKIPLLINKDMFELSYNDVKFMIQNHNYFFTKLILIYVISTCAVNTKVTATTFCFRVNYLLKQVRGKTAQILVSNNILQNRPRFLREMPDCRTGAKIHKMILKHSKVTRK